MTSYDLIEDVVSTGTVSAVNWLDEYGRHSAPLRASNRDCRQFIIDWKAGAEVLSPAGTPAPYSDDAVRALGLEP